METSAKFKNSDSKISIFEYLPFVLTNLIAFSILTVFISSHCLPIIQIDEIKHVTDLKFNRGILELLIIGFLFIGFFSSLIMTLIVHPGTTPNSSDWHFNPLSHLEENPRQISNSQDFFEKKRTGESRYCKWCMKLKPDRSHHCRICNKCILKMDHHCPWITNCVGWGNHKYFMLTLIYGCMGSLFSTFTMAETVFKTTKDNLDSVIEHIVTCFICTIDLFMSLTLISYLSFHLWLILKGMTTIEYCEKHSSTFTTNPQELWNLGLLNNFSHVFGSNPILWFIPYDNRSGNGINFISESNFSPQYKDRSFEPLTD